MPFTTRALPLRGATILVVIATLACGADDGPVQLAYQLDGELGQSFVTTLDQEIAFAMGDHAMEGTREIRAGYTIRATDAAGGDLISRVRIDTVRASMIWGESQERIDTRHLAGLEFPMTVAAAGGPPAYDQTELPVIDMGGRGGGALPASMLIDYGFPLLPEEPVSPGSTWSETRTVRRLEATMWVTAEVQTTYRVAGTETVDGSRCVAIESESTGTLSDGFAHGADVPFSGALQGSATWCFDALSGVLVRMKGEEATEGSTQAPDGAAVTLNQTTRVDIHRVTASERSER